jgi:hypothetical protein
VSLSGATRLAGTLLSIMGLAGAAAGCGDSSDPAIETVVAGDDFDEPTALAFRPGPTVSSG